MYTALCDDNYIIAAVPVLNIVGKNGFPVADAGISVKSCHIKRVAAERTISIHELKGTIDSATCRCEGGAMNKLGNPECLSKDISKINILHKYLQRLLFRWFTSHICRFRRKIPEPAPYTAAAATYMKQCHPSPKRRMTLFSCFTNAFRLLRAAGYCAEAKSASTFSQCAAMSSESILNAACTSSIQMLSYSLEK